MRSIDISTIEIDGSVGEGGGQMIRTSLSLSAITKQPVRIFNIRANRPNPGLAAQHLAAAKAVRSICRGTLEGAEIGSKELQFNPGEIIGGKYEFKIGTAGSTSLVAQTILPILLFAKKESEVRIHGGTHVIKSPGYDYFERVFLPAIRNYGIEVNSKLIRPGFYPNGGGEIALEVKPAKPIGFSTWDRNEHVQVLIRLSGLPPSVAIREKKIFVENGIGHINVFEDEADSQGNAVTAWKGFRGAYVPGEKGKKAEIVAKEALDMLNFENGDVDSHLADQLLIYAALAEGKSAYITSKITQHTVTNLEIIRKFINRKISLQGNEILVD